MATIWEHLSNITYDKGEYLGDENWNIHMVNRFLSMDENYCELVSILQKNLRPYSYIPNDVMYKIYRDLIPKQKKYLKYIKSTVKKKTYDENELNALIQYFEISSKEAKDYVDLLPKQELKIIMDHTGYGK